MKQTFTQTVRHVAEWSPNREIRSLEELRPDFWFNQEPVMDAPVRIPSGSCVKLETNYGNIGERRYLLYPSFCHRRGAF